MLERVKHWVIGMLFSVFCTWFSEWLCVKKMFCIYMSLVWALSFEKLESVVDCAFWIDDSHEDVALLYVWLWEIDGYSECVEVMDGMNELIDDSSENTQLFMLLCFRGRILYEMRWSSVVSIFLCSCFWLYLLLHRKLD